MPSASATKAGWTAVEVDISPQSRQGSPTSLSLLASNSTTIVSRAPTTFVAWRVTCVPTEDCFGIGGGKMMGFCVNDGERN